MKDTIKCLLVFLPSDFCNQESGYMFGKSTYDAENKVKKFYITGVHENKLHPDTIGYWSTQAIAPATENNISAVDWIDACCYRPPADHDTYLESFRRKKIGQHDYSLTNVIVNRKRLSTNMLHTVIIVYDRLALFEAELFGRQTVPSDWGGNHFQELKEILEKKKAVSAAASGTNNGDNRGFGELIFTSFILVILYPILFLSEITNNLVGIVKYSSLGLHLHGWLENIKWMLLALIRDKKFTLKTGNHLMATIFDISLGLFVIRLLLHTIGDTPPSQILLDNAEKVVDFLKNLVDWLMGAPAGLKLNRSFNKMLGKFFLYHIHLWWTFLVFIKPVMDFAFQVLTLFGRLGVTFQIAIAADILALVSFHTYCIYVYAARLFNIQVRGLTALFRLFLGKKKNPLRERVDSCQYQPDQLFVGTLLFTILLFLMPTTWVYYTVFTTLRVMLIGLGGLLSRLGFYMQVIPIYTFSSWFFRSRNTSSAVKMTVYNDGSKDSASPVKLIMTTVRAPWSDTWKRCIPDTVTHRPSIEWTTIVKNIISGQLLYPL